MVLETVKVVDQSITARLVKPGSSIARVVDALPGLDEKGMDALEVGFLADLHLTLFDESISL